MINAHKQDWWARQFGEPIWQMDPREGNHERCSYCGSIKLETVLELLARPGTHFSGSDWKYGWPHKFYIMPENTQGGLFWLGGANTKEAPAPEGYTHASELTPEQVAIVERDLGQKLDEVKYVWHRFGPLQRFHLKFYNVHLVDYPEAMIQQYAALTKKIFMVDFCTQDNMVRWAALPNIQKWGFIGNDGEPVFES